MIPLRYAFIGLIALQIYPGSLSLQAQPVFNEHSVASAYNCWSACLFDIDNDSDSDIVGTSRNGNKLSWWENDGTGSFVLHQISTAAINPMGVVATDLDGDGDADIVCTLQGEDRVDWWKNDGSQNFTRDTVGYLLSPNQLCSADLDNDGDMDIAAAACEEGSHKVVWFENDGSETFTVHIVKENWDHANSVTVSDVNGDGYPDLIATASFRYSTTGGEISWFENTGSGQFLEHNVITDYYRPSNAIGADIDGDLDMDILATVCNLNSIELFRNDGTQNFVRETIYTGFTRPHCIMTADLDSDGDPDILATAIDEDQIAWWENDSNNWTKRVIVSGFYGATWLDVGDIDLDGDPDVLGTAQFANKIKWFENTPYTGIDPLREPATNFLTDFRADPNPATEATSVRFTIARESRLAFYLRDAIGNRIGIIAESSYPAGTSSISLSQFRKGRPDKAPGIYFLTVADKFGLPLKSIRLVIL